MKRNKPALIGASVVALAATALTPTTTASAAPEDTARTSHEGRIVATALGPGYVVSMLPDGTDRQRITAFPKGAFVGGLDVTDDGSQVAMTFGPGNRGHIYTVNSDGSDFQQVSSGGDDGGPTYSPNGSRIAFERDVFAGEDVLMRMRADGSALTNLTTGAEPRPAFQSWSPDGQYIAFTSYIGKKQAIVLTDPKGTWFRFVRTFPGDRGQLFTLNWSPDSSQIIYARYTPNYDNADLWAVTTDGSSVTRITNTPNLAEVSPAYSPDGSQIACSVQSESGGWADVLVMDADGGNRNRIRTEAADEYHVAWGGTPT